MFSEIGTNFLKSKTIIVTTILMVGIFIFVNVLITVGSLNSSSKKEPPPNLLSSSNNFSLGNNSENSDGENFSKKNSDKEVDLNHFEVYRYKDPFEPFLPQSSSSSISISETSIQGSSASSSSSSSQSETPLVKRVYEKDGSEYADVEYQGVTYTVTEGETVGNSSYQVLDIDVENKTVTFLFGDERVVLKEGEETPLK